MDEHVGGYSTFYVTSKPLLDRALELLAMLREDLDHLGADGCAAFVKPAPDK